MDSSEQLKDTNFVAKEVEKTCNELKDLLISKNRKYGNAVYNPAGIFSKANPEEQMRTRMDDKIQRIKAAQHDDDEDAIMDLAGYLILLMTYRRIISQ